MTDLSHYSDFISISISIFFSLDSSNKLPNIKLYRDKNLYPGHGTNVVGAVRKYVKKYNGSYSGFYFRYAYVSHRHKIETK